MGTARRAASSVGNASAAGCGVLFIAVWVIGWSAGTLFGTVMAVCGVVMQAKSADYAAVQGKIIKSKVKVDTSDDGTSYSPQAEYEYVVNGRRYTGTRIRYGVTSGGKRSAKRFVASRPAGSAITVRYNPARPDDALLEPGVSGGDLFLFMFLTPFNVVMLGSWYVVAGWIGNRRDPRRRLARRLRVRGTTSVVRVPGLSPVAVGGITAGAVAFVMIFAVGFPTDMNPSTTTMTVALTVMLGVAVWAGKRRADRLARGTNDLEVDPIRRTLTFPLRKKQVSREVCGFDQVDEVMVRRRRTTGDDSVTTRFSPMVRWTDGRGRPRTTGVGYYHDEADAGALADWLNEQVLGNTAASPLTPGGLKA